jgi:hypothetical protein
MSENKDLVVKNEGFIVPTADNNIAQAMSEEMEGLQITFDRVKIPSGGGLAFEVPGDDPESPDMEKEIIGVIVDHHPINAYWENKYDGANNAPDCSSMDGKTGTGNPGGNCKTCPYNQFGSDGNGKACKNMHRVYLLRSGEMFPILLTLPPTSIRNFSNYMAKRVITKGYRSYGVITKIMLKRVQNSTGISYSQAQFSLVDRLSPEEQEQMRDFSQGIKTVTREIEVADNEYMQDDTSNSMPAYNEKLPF